MARLRPTVLLKERPFSSLISLPSAWSVPLSVFICQKQLSRVASVGPVVVLSSSTSLQLDEGLVVPALAHEPARRFALVASLHEVKSKVWVVILSVVMFDVTVP